MRLPTAVFHSEPNRPGFGWAYLQKKRFPLSNQSSADFTLLSFIISMLTVTAKMSIGKCAINELYAYDTRLRWRSYFRITQLVAFFLPNDIKVYINMLIYS